MSAHKASIGITAVALLATSLIYTGGAYAASSDMSGTPDPTTNQDTDQNAAAPTQPSLPGDHHSQMMARNVEARIKTLHDKLGITSAQETEWEAVAQTMRDNETTIHQLIETRHQNPQSMTAIDDLQSYQNITQAHADGIKKLVTTFQTLYSELSEKQKTSADRAFSSFEGHGTMKKHA